MREVEVVRQVSRTRQKEIVEHQLGLEDCVSGALHVHFGQRNVFLSLIRIRKTFSLPLDRFFFGE